VPRHLHPRCAGAWRDDGRIGAAAPFFQHNRKLILDIEALEHRSRRPDVLVDEI